MPSVGTFGAVPFGVRVGGANRSTESEFTEMHIPGSNTNVIDMSGLLPEKLSYELFFTSDTDYDSMRAKVGTSDTLTAFDLSFTAYLKSLRRSFVNPLGVYATIATAEFVEYTAIL
jgi:hypothetical protein